MLVIVGPGTETFRVGVTRDNFPGVNIAYLSAHVNTGRQVVTGLLSVHVVPQAGHSAMASQARSEFDVAAWLEPEPFAAPPTEADLANVFVHAMSAHGHPPGTTGFGLATRLACDLWGWRTVADLVNTLGDIACASGDVTAALTALTAEPEASVRTK